jgi:hypothetical protein
VVEINYALIPDTIKVLDKEVGSLAHTQNGRNIGVGAVSKAKWLGTGWIMWTDHFRTPEHGTTVKAFLTFEDPRQETIFRLKHPNLLSYKK